MAANRDQAAMDRRAKEIEKEYLSSLADLNVNSKPLINMLTILAEENLDYASVIVSAVEKHLTQVESEVKLPILYLVDSIVKNVGNLYPSLFSQVIVNMFCGVFETVNERIREKMFSLRQTWNEVFPQSKLYALDIKINSIDPGWPITAQLKPKSPAIHLNPKFLNNKGTEPNLDMQQQLRDKQRELLELQARKLELELLATKKRIEEQEKQLVLQTASVSKEPPPDVKKVVNTAVGSAQQAPSVPASRGRILPPNPGMLSLIKPSRDPRVARQQAQLAAQMVATNANSTPTTTPGLQIPSQTPTALDPSGKVLSIKERLGRIPKRTDPRLKPNVTEADRKKSSSVMSSSSVSSSSHKSRNEYDPAKKRDKREEVSPKSNKSSSMKTSSEKKKSSDSSPLKSSSPSKKKSISSEKSPARSEKNSKTRDNKSSKICKTGTRRPYDSSKSPDSTTISPMSSSESLLQTPSESKDVDLRVSVPEKKLKVDEEVQYKPCSQLEVEQQPLQQSPQEQPQQPIKQQLSEMEKVFDKPVAEQKKVLGQAVETENIPDPKDVDFRILPPPLPKEIMESVVSSTDVAPISVPTSTVANCTSTTDSVSTTTSVTPASPEATKKRPSVSKLDEPAVKKSKSELLDDLFGDKDIDLRKLPPSMVSSEVLPPLPLPPPPPIISEIPRTSIPVPNQNLNDSLEKQNSTSSKTALEAARAKFAEATKNKNRDNLGRLRLYEKLPDDPAERRRSFSQPKAMDVDMRQQHPVQSQIPVLDTMQDDNSQDGLTTNIKTIITQAQEQMEKGEITAEQYNILMKQVIQLNETQKIRQAQRIEMMKRNQVINPVVNPVMSVPPPNVHTEDATHSLSNEDITVLNSPSNEDTEVKPSSTSLPISSHTAVAKNDFRGKIAPLDTKPKFEVPSFANATAADLRQRDPRRQRESRFNQQPWVNRPGPVPPMVVPILNHRPPAPMLNPWEQAPFPIIDQSVPPPVGPRFPPVVPSMKTVPPPANVLVPGVAKLNDSVRTINIDGIQREIRFYDDIAVIFMSWDEPKEIGFQKGSRMVVVDDRDSFELSFNDCYKAITIDNKVYQMKLGAPTRELYIDNNYYECYFGDPPSNIVLDGINRVFKISGPAPQVKIGNSRNDLVAGKINMIINAETIIPVFLDSQVQMFEIHGQIHKLQFADFLLTVIIDDQPFMVEYGGLPKVFKLRGKDFYIRFTAVPKLVVPGRVYVRDMIRTPLHRDLRTPPRDPSMLQPFVPPMANVISTLSAPPAIPAGLFQAASVIPPPPQAPVVQPITTGLDYLTNLMPHTTAAVNVSNNQAGYQIQAEDKPIVPVTSSSSAPSISTPSLNLPILQNVNIDELYQKIVAAGFLNKANSAPPSTSSSSTSVASKLDKALDEELEEIDPVFLNKPDTLKRRQSAIVTQLFSGMQCSSCGVRFPPEQTMKYSQHLDWHFRQNRRDRDSARKAHSRKWYYDVSDWIQYEEIEDLEEREKNWFETQQTEQVEFNGDGEPSGRNSESPLPSCPAGPEEVDKRCHMCHDEFEQFYNEETEEWHLKNAIRMEENTYHPLCYEDYKASLTLDETAMNVTNEEGEQSKTDEDEVVIHIKQETVSDDADDSVKEITLDDDDDVIVLPPTEDIVTEIPDDDDVETLDSHSTADENKANSIPVTDDELSKQTSCETTEISTKVIHEPVIVETQIDDDIAIREPTIERIDVNDLDESDDFTSKLPNALDENSQASQSSLSVVKVKVEPKDEDEIDEEDALFEDVGTIESSAVEVQKDTDTVDLETVSSPSPPLESTSQNQLKPSMDGNMELQETPSAGIIPNKIKINITKAKTSNTAVSNSATNNVSTITTSANSSSNQSSHTYSNMGGSVIAVRISGDSDRYNENSNDDLYSNLDDLHGGHNENSQNSSNQLIMMHEEELDDSNKGPIVVSEEEPTDIAYDLKPSLQGINFTRHPRVENGFETSGLCSIM